MCVCIYYSTVAGSLNLFVKIFSFYPQMTLKRLCICKQYLYCAKMIDKYSKSIAVSASVWQLQSRQIYSARFRLHLKI